MNVLDAWVVGWILCKRIVGWGLRSSLDGHGVVTKGPVLPGSNDPTVLLPKLHLPLFDALVARSDLQKL